VFAFVVRRLISAVVVVLLATIVVFALVSARGSPLDQYLHRPGIDPQTLDNLKHEYHLDEPWIVQYGDWLRDFVRGDWHDSFRTQQPVADMVGKAAWNSFLLVGTALLFSVVLALFIGVISAVRQYSFFDHAATSFSYFGFSMPDFFFALLLQLFVVAVLHEQLGIDVLYVQGKYSVGQQGDIVNLIEHMVLPVAVLMLTSVAAWSRYQRDSMLEVLHTDYVRTARAKGVPRRQVIRRHALRNALIPFVTVVAIDAGVLLGGVVVIERVFDWPGLGLLFFDALTAHDYPVVLAWMAVTTAFVVVANLVADILYAALDPRVRLGGPYRRRRARAT
jgi:peptide/nickel transport system permease protein